MIFKFSNEVVEAKSVFIDLTDHKKRPGIEVTIKIGNENYTDFYYFYLKNKQITDVNNYTKAMNLIIKNIIEHIYQEEYYDFSKLDLDATYEKHLFRIKREKTNE